MPASALRLPHVWPVTSWPHAVTYSIRVDIGLKKRILVQSFLYKSSRSARVWRFQNPAVRCSWTEDKFWIYPLLSSPLSYSTTYLTAFVRSDRSYRRLVASKQLSSYVRVWLRLDRSCSAHLWWTGLICWRQFRSIAPCLVLVPTSIQVTTFLVWNYSQTTGMLKVVLLYMCCLRFFNRCIRCVGAIPTKSACVWCVRISK